ncbi:MAG TPA: hypothetical protein VG275_01590 [Solirubrobacteraceae bacterium]|nr:hypothetical protein [Solirubrobacteraceae bacterium]
MSPPCVVHLVWAPLGPDVVRRFAESYTQHPAGTGHTLTVLYNGFHGAHDPRLEQTRAALASIDHSEIVLEQPVLDLTAYRLAAERVPATRYCFLNSYTRLLTPNWLHHLDQALAAPGIGLAGATGSWASPLTQLRYEFGLGGAYAAAQADRRRALLRMRRLSEAAAVQSTPAAEPKLLRQLRTAHSMLRRVTDFPPFPNYHLRTNAFMVDREVLLRIGWRAVDDKLDAWALESGWRSLTRRVQKLGLRAVVVARDGRAYQREEWPHSHTLWQGEQENLLIADNQTDSYHDADPELRAVLSAFAWGTQANP